MRAHLRLSVIQGLPVTLVLPGKECSCTELYTNACCQGLLTVLAYKKGSVRCGECSPAVVILELAFTTYALGTLSKPVTCSPATI